MLSKTCEPSWKYLQDEWGSALKLFQDLTKKNTSDKKDQQTAIFQGVYKLEQVTYLPPAPPSLLFKLTVLPFSHFCYFLFQRCNLSSPQQINYLRDLSIIELHQMLSQFNSLLDFYFINFHQKLKREKKMQRTPVRTTYYNYRWGMVKGRPCPSFCSQFNKLMYLKLHINVSFKKEMPSTSHICSWKTLLSLSVSSAIWSK